jgi:hypothetical protein
MIDNKYIRKDIFKKNENMFFFKNDIFYLPALSETIIGKLVRRCTRAHISTSGRLVVNIFGASFLIHCLVSGTKPTLSVWQ